MSSPCPPEHELAELAEGRAGDAAPRIRGHVDECDDCRIVLARLLTHRRVAPPTASVIAGRYRLQRRIGKGGMGEVHEAWDLNLERRVAIKTLLALGNDRDDSERRIARLVRESKAMARLRHPNVVAVHDAGVWEGQAYVVMELVDGETLRAWVQRPGAAHSFEAIVAMFVAAGRGLQAAHLHGIVHRDFKPDNVLISESPSGVDEHGRAQVTDFGLARWHDGVDGTIVTGFDLDVEMPSASAVLDQSGSLTETGVAVGTPAYMAPEQFRRHDVDARADVFAFCVALFEALAGRRPFAGASPREILDAQRRGASDDFLRARGVPGWLRDAVLAGLQFDPQRRPRDMTTLLRLLQPPASRSRWLVRVGGLAVIGLGTGGALLAGTRSDDPCVDRDPLAQIWNDDARATIDPSAHATSRTPALLDRWSQGWTEAWKLSCAAAKKDREAGLRRSCLLGQRSAFAAVVERVRTGEIDATAVERGLPRVRDCGGNRDLARLRPEPDDPEAAMRVAVVRTELDALIGLQNTGDARDLDARAEGAVVAARAIGFRPIEAEALYVAGLQHTARGRPLEARTTLVDAAQVAGASGHDSAAASAWLALVELEADELHEFERGHEYTNNARAAIERLGVSTAVEELDMLLRFVFGKLLWQQGRTDEAKAEFRIGEALARRIDPEQLDAMLEGLAVVLEEEGSIEEAIALYTELAERRRTQLGEDHPLLVISYANLASAHSMLGELDVALEYAQRATTVARAEGEQHPDYAGALHNEGELLRELGRYDEALARLQQAEALFEASSGAESFRVASSLMHEAGVLQGLQRYDESIALMRRSLEIFDRQQSPRDIANARMNLADVLRESGHAVDALPHARAAVELLEEHGTGSPEHGYSLSVRGEVELALGRTTDAIESLERAREVYANGEFLPNHAALTLYLLSRALDERGDDRARASALLDEAEHGLEGAPPSWDLRKRELAAYRLTRAARTPP